MYLSIRISLIEKAIKFYSSHLPKETQSKINKCIKMIKFHMDSCLISFDGKYYKYKGGEAESDKGLVIGGYESAFLANLVASYLLEETEEYFEKTKFHGIYRDDGIVAFNGKLTFAEIQVWLKRFQEKINKITGGTFLNFTIEIWKPCEDDEVKGNKCTKNTEPNFPFLDMEMLWSTKGTLYFQAYAKPNQKILYVDKRSAHRKSCLRAIPNGVLKRLARLTSKDSQLVSDQKN